MKSFFMFRFVYFFLFAFLLVSLPTPSFAQEAAQSLNQERVGDWFVTCEKEDDKSCVMVQEVIMNKDGQKGRLASLVIFKDINDGQVKGRFLVPLGIYLLDGLYFQIDDKKPYKTNIETCSQQGCMVSLLLKDDLLTQFKAGNKLSVYYAIQPGKKFETQMSLKGFTKAYDKTFN